MAKKSDNSRSILDLLSDEERAAAAERVIEQQIADAVETGRSENQTIGDFVAALQAHEFWDEISLASASLVFGEKPQTRRPQSARITDEDVAAVKKYITKNPGQKVTEIVAGTALEQSVVTRSIAKLKKLGEVSSEGSARATTYSA